MNHKNILATLREAYTEIFGEIFSNEVLKRVDKIISEINAKLDTEETLLTE